jgi:stress response protein YsnF
MLSEREVAAAIGSTAYGPDGSKIGTVENFFVDDRTGVPTWVSVATGLFGTRHSIAPAAEATVGDGGLRLPVTADAVKAAPRLAGTHLDPAEEQALRTHYGLADPAPHPDDLEPAPPSDALPSDIPSSHAEPSYAEPFPADPSPGETAAEPAEPAEEPIAAAPPAVAGDDDDDDDDDGGMVRSEEQLRVGTERVSATRFRLVKYVVTEDVQITVPIRREEIRVEEVPVDAADSDGGEGTEGLVQHGDLAEGERPGRHTAPDDGSLPEEIILHTERPVVSVEVVPIERVRLHREVVEGAETVTGQVQREQIVVDQDPGQHV